MNVSGSMVCRMVDKTNIGNLMAQLHDCSMKRWQRRIFREASGPLLTFLDFSARFLSTIKGEIPGISSQYRLRELSGDLFKRLSEQSERLLCLLRYC